MPLTEGEVSPFSCIVKKRTAFAIVVAWGLTVASGFTALARYAGEAGELAEGTPFWPSESSITRTGKPTLVVVAHSECPCTRATIRDLEKLSARIDADVWVVFANKPRGSELEKDAARFAHVLSDPIEANRFGAKTSGQAFLYSAGGKLIFSGGLTPSRGHEEDTNGQARIRSLVRGRAEGSSDAGHGEDRAPVFGCPIGARSAS